MNAAEQRFTQSVGATDAVNDANPWLGLASFTEETRGFFYGREDEIAELARRVQRKLLTVLFGQSGLGKTSILRAGLVPRLRSQSYCPVYVRIDYGRDSPEPAEQIKEAIRRAASESGQWTQVGVAVANESLWEFLHHRDDVLRDAAGNTLTPLLIFDQFEEIFTLAQSDDFGRARATRFIEELADLVENRPPKSLEKRFDEDESSAERFDFARSDYRVLIALREDYLAPLESLKQSMPSISQNRLRLAPMTGTQALAAVTRPGRKLVSEEVAAAIVRFVAGGAELPNAEVEPSLLSLICRELNDARIAQGRSEISLDLLAGSHATILSNFYERALADQPPAVRRIIEDTLLTASGFRENVAEESLMKRFAEAGASRETLAVLVNRRLLRVEERLDVRRVELTHDVLCGVVKASRDQRQEREAREATESLLAEQRERELSARRALIKARQIAAVCIGLAVIALGAAVFAYLNGLRAQRAEHQAQETRAHAEQARQQAEHLLGYLTNDFVRELESFGQLKVIAEFTQRQIEYFHALPEGLKGPETIRNGALALVRHARVMRVLGQPEEALKNSEEAVRLLEQQRAAGDRSEASIIALALAYTSMSQILDNQNDARGHPTLMKAVELMKPIADGPNASAAARRAYVEVLVRLTYQQAYSNQNEAAYATGMHARELAVGMGARDLSSLEMGALYAEVGAWTVTALINMGRDAEAKEIGEDAVAVADRVLEVRPGYRLALHAQQVVESIMGGVAQDGLDPAEELRAGKRTEQVSLTLLKLDPNNITSMNNMGVAYQTIAQALWAQGKLHEAAATWEHAVDYFNQAAAGGTGFVMVRTGAMLEVVLRSTMAGEFERVPRLRASGEPLLAKVRNTTAPNSIVIQILDAGMKMPDAMVALERDDLQTARRLANESANQIRAAQAANPHETLQRQYALTAALDILSRADFQRNDFAAAEKEAQEALALRAQVGSGAVQDKRDLGDLSTLLAAAVAHQGRFAEAAGLIAQVVKLQRELAAKNHGDVWVPFELANALYVQALTDPQHRSALLREAAALQDGLPPSLRNLHDVKLWRTRIQQAQSGAS